MATRQRRSTRASVLYYGTHKTDRKRAMAALAARQGQPCPRCGLPMFTWQRLDLDHATDSTYLGLSHASCNRRAGQRVTTAILRARGWTPSPRQVAAIRAKQRGRRW